MMVVRALCTQAAVNEWRTGGTGTMIDEQGMITGIRMRADELYAQIVGK